MQNDIVNVQFRPFKGKDYERGINGKKVLILGESHHHNCEKAGDCCNHLTTSKRIERHRRLTCEEVEWWKQNPAKTPLSHALPKLFGLPRYEFWDHVSFYNYVQSFVAAPRRRPNDEQFKESAKAFQEVLNHLRPDRILVLGKQCWLSLPGNDDPVSKPPIIERNIMASRRLGLRESNDGFAYWYYCRGKQWALALPIAHPSSFGFRSADYIDSIRKWMSFSGKPK